MKTVMKLLAALAAITGAIYVIATYGEQIVAWAKKLMGACTCNCDECTCEECDCEECAEEEVVEEAEEAPAEEEAVEEVPVEEVVVDETEPVAEEADFEA